MKKNSAWDVDFNFETAPKLINCMSSVKDSQRMIKHNKNVARAVNDTFLIIYLTCIILDKTDMGKFLFSLGYRI
jgi:hypothetical protein